MGGRRHNTTGYRALMLRSTFQRLVRGISPEREAKLWAKGIVSWEDLEMLRSPQRSPFDENNPRPDASPFPVLRRALQTEDAEYFSNALDRREHYRIALTFPHRVLFLDIETTGLSRFYDYVTLVGWSYQGEYRVLVRGHDTAALREALADALAVVTFNGAIFDLPFLRQEFPDLKLPPVHLDLRFLAKRVGLSGGQKVLEEELGFVRPANVQHVKGEAAPLLWHKYRRGDSSALKLLIEYNHCDVEGMKFIFDRVMKKLTAARRLPRSIRRQLPRLAVRTEIVWANGKRSDRFGSPAIKLTPYTGPHGPAVTLAGLTAGSGTGPLRVVGIDLTGSEARLSGWCQLDGDEAVTRMIGPDEELVATTLAARPHLVSIDSPLSLPKGRLSVSDNDPGRDEYGIMRQCERILKKRGINVYPALIPSMQKLTARGIQLAARFRALGLPVIESYPGAAQDIMGIPRKRASLDMLRDGLAEFGVRGKYQTDPVTHDELDAITAAVVGVFFWSGKFESLGSEEEEALIIPDLKVDTRAWCERLVVGVSGPVAAGKTTLARFLESSGFSYARYSMVLEELLKSGSRSVARKDLQAFGERVHRERGQRWLGRKLKASLRATGNIVIDGIRFPDDHAFLVEAFGPAFRHIHLDAPTELRAPRFRRREKRGNSFAAADSHPVEAQVPALRKLAHALVVNEGTFDDLATQLTNLLPTETLET